MSDQATPPPERITRSATIDKGDDEYKITQNKDDQVRIIPPKEHPKSQLLRYFPIAYWLPNYNVKAHLTGDVIAGLTAGVMLIPQGMAYALIAGLDPVYGLYSAMFGPLIYAAFGTSGQLSVAPVAIVSLLTAEGVESQIDVEEGHEKHDIKYLALASTLAFQVGIVQAGLGLLQAGVLASMLSHSVIVGFTGAAAFLIGMSQIKHCLRIEIDRGEFIEMLIDLFKNIGDTEWETVLMSLVCIIILLFLKIWKKKKHWYGSKQAKFIPGALIVVVLSTLVSYAIHDEKVFAIVGEQDNGLPEFDNFFDHIEMNQFWSLWTTSILISIIAFLESYAVANKYAEMKNYSIDASQEFLALGVTNIVACWFQTYPVTGGLSRTAVAEAAGAWTPLCSAIQGVFMIFALAVLLTLFKWLPKACLGAIVIVAVINLFDYKAMMHLWKLKKRDFWVMAVTLIVTLVLGIETGVAVGVVASLLMFVQRASKPHYAILGKLPDEENVWRNVKNYENAIQRNDMLILRWDASLFFANIDIFKKRILKHIGRFLSEHKYPKHWCLIVNFSGINDCDASAAEQLHSFFGELKHKFDGFQLLITNLKKPVRLVLEVAEVIEEVGDDKVFFEMGDAVKYWDNYMANMGINSAASIDDSAQDGHPLLNDDGVSKDKGKVSEPNTQELINENGNNNENEDNDPDINDDNVVKVDIKEENDS